MSQYFKHCILKNSRQSVYFNCLQNKKIIWRGEKLTQLIMKTVVYLTHWQCRWFASVWVLMWKSLFFLFSRISPPARLPAIPVLSPEQLLALNPHCDPSADLLAVPCQPHQAATALGSRAQKMSAEMFHTGLCPSPWHPTCPGLTAPAAGPSPWALTQILKIPNPSKTAPRSCWVSCSTISQSSTARRIFSMSHPLLYLQEKMKQPPEYFYWNNSSHSTNWTEKNCNEGRVAF